MEGSKSLKLGNEELYQHLLPLNRFQICGQKLYFSIRQDYAIRLDFDFSLFI